MNIFIYLKIFEKLEFYIMLFVIKLKIYVFLINVF